MKRCILFGISLILLLGLAACAVVPKETVPDVAAPEVTLPNVTVPDVTVPEPTTPDVTEPDVTDPEGTHDLVYDMNNYEWFSSIFEEKDVEEWNAMGKYTIHLEGLHTPVAVNMDGTSVLSVTAFDQTVYLGRAGMAYDYFDGYSPIDYIRSTKDAAVIRICGGESPDDFILITKDKIFKYPNKRDGQISLWVKEDGTLGYRQTWIYPDDIEEACFIALEWFSSRDQLLFQNGSAEIVGGELVLTAEETVVLSDLFDLDTMFAEGKAAGNYTEYETLDELFEANKNNAT